MATPSQDLMLCARCGQEKPPSEMTARTRRGREKLCHSCQLAYYRKYRSENREKDNAAKAEWLSRNKDKVREQYIARRKSKIAAMTEAELVAFRKFESDKAKRQSAAIKNKVFIAYGGWRCACCGESERSFLTIDHMLNNGSQLRREGVHGHSTKFYRWLVREGFPANFQVLCMNCQFGKRMNDGICPHQCKV
jgi:hypothetical protein